MSFCQVGSIKRLLLWKKKLREGRQTLKPGTDDGIAVNQLK